MSISKNFPRVSLVSPLARRERDGGRVFQLGNSIFGRFERDRKLYFRLHLFQDEQMTLGIAATTKPSDGKALLVWLHTNNCPRT